MTEERIARNDSIFRDANEQINAKAKEHATDEEQAVPFICECADEHCTTIVPLSLAEYEDVRTDSRQFLTVRPRTVRGACRGRLHEPQPSRCAEVRTGGRYRRVAGQTP